jgi:hypothetical protein
MPMSVARYLRSRRFRSREIARPDPQRLAYSALHGLSQRYTTAYQAIARVQQESERDALYRDYLTPADAFEKPEVVPHMQIPVGLEPDRYVEW